VRDTIDYGIDLGTTNSAIAVVDDGVVSVIKNAAHHADTTPSAVSVPRPEVVQVGQRARARSKDDPENVATEFKLEMGYANASRHFPGSGVTMTPQQLSAEVLKSLRADVATHRGDPPDSVVITVPAAFSLNQNKATSDAAALAGFGGSCPLVQEPTAAAFAYGLQDSAERAYWMVFDFGGGTFDAAIVSKRDGELHVLNHAGDPYLGGKLIDWAIVETLLAPQVARELGRADFTRDSTDPEVIRALGTLKFEAEAAKIDLSAQEATLVDFEVTIGGKRHGFDLTLRRADVERLAEPFFQRAIRCCQAALAEGQLRPSDIDRLLLVGGPTQAPGLRRLLADPQAGLGIELDFSQDPATAVARGAALYASTVRVDRPLAVPKRGEVAVDLSYPPTTSMLRPTVAGTLHGVGGENWPDHRVSLHAPEAQPPFHGDPVAPNAAGRFDTEVVLPVRSTTRFTVRVMDPAGRPAKVIPDTLTITHRDTEVASQVLSKQLGIGTADNTLSKLVAKGVALPHTVTRPFVTSSPLHKNDEKSVIRIPVLEGERDRADRNHQIGMLEIWSRDLRYDLPAGSDVEVTIEIDTSGLLNVVADVLAAKIQVEADIDLNNVQAPGAGVLEERLAEAELRLSRLRSDGAGSIGVQDQFAMLDLDNQLAVCRDLVRAARTDLGAAASAQEKLLDLQAALDQIEKASEFPRLVRELQDVLAECDSLVQRHGRQADRRELADIQQRADAAIATQDQKVARAQLERARSLAVEFLREQSDWPAIVFVALRDLHGDLRPAHEAEKLIGEGERALGRGDMAGLDRVNNGLRKLIPPDMPDPTVGLKESS
jgi:molecular chaperone DnaK